MSEAPRGKVEIRAIERADLPAVAEFLNRERSATPGEPGAAADPSKLAWFLFEHPLASAELPTGWLARDAGGGVVGTKLCFPQRFVCSGAPYLLLHGGGYYVAATHRGVGLSLMARLLEVAKRMAVFSTTMNELSGAIYERYGGYPIARSDREWLGVLRWSPLVEEVLVRRLGRPALARAAAAVAALRPAAVRPAAGDRLTRLAPDALAALAIEPPPEHANELTAERDPAFLRWRYFGGDDPSCALYAYASPSGGRALVGVNVRTRGHRQQVRALSVLDYFGRLPAEEIAEVARALADRHGREADVIVFRGQPAARAEVLLRAGFVERALPRAIGVCIDRAGLLPTRDWYLQPADGDAGF
jgi:hypothetical protein